METTKPTATNLFPRWRIERRFVNLPPVTLADGLPDEREGRLALQRLNVKLPKQRLALVHSAFVLTETTVEERGEVSIFDRP